MSAFGRTLTPVVSRTSGIFTGPGDFTFTSENMVIVKKTVAAPTTVIMPSQPGAPCEFVVKDGKGDASANNITIDGNGKLIDGQAQYVISTNRGSITLFWDGEEYHVIGVQP